MGFNNEAASVCDINNILGNLIFFKIIGKLVSVMTMLVAAVIEHCRDVLCGEPLPHCGTIIMLAGNPLTSFIKLVR